MTVRVVVENPDAIRPFQVCKSRVQKLMAEDLHRICRFASPWARDVYNSLPGQLEVDSRCRRVGRAVTPELFPGLDLRNA